MVQIGTRDGKPTYLTETERETHLQVIGDSRQGKSRFLQHLIRHDINAGNGVCVIDPHGELYDDLVKWLAYHQFHRDPRYRGKIHLLDPRDQQWTVGFNPLATAANNGPPYVRTGAMTKACVQVWDGKDISETPRLAKCLRLVFYALAQNNLSLAEASKLTNYPFKDIRRELLQPIDNSEYIDQWASMEYFRAHDFNTMFESVASRMLSFVGTPPLKEIVGQTHNVLDLQECMDDGHIVLVNLNGERHSDYYDARVIGAMLLSELDAACRRRDQKFAKVRPFHCYIDECADFLTQDVARAMYQTAKYGLHFTLAHQDLQQLRDHGETMFRAVWGGAQSKVVFRCSEQSSAEELCLRLFRRHFDLTETVSVQSRPTTVGYETVWLRSEVDAVAEAEFTSWSHGDTVSLGAGVSQVTDMGGVEVGGLQTRTENEGLVSSNMSGEGTSVSRSHAQGRSQAMRPILEWLPELERKRLEEHIHEGIVRILGLSKRHPIVMPVDKEPFRITAPNVVVPEVRQDQIRAFVDAVGEASPFTAERPLVAEELRTRDNAIRTLAHFRRDSRGGEDVGEYSSAEPASAKLRV